MQRYGTWTIQGLLAALFVFAGAMKLMAPVEVLAQQSPLPGLFMQFVGVAEVLGGLGLVVPAVLRVRPELTMLAAIELAHVMLGAVVLTLATGGGALAVMPAGVGLLACLVAYVRTPQAARRARLGTTPRAAYSTV